MTTFAIDTEYTRRLAHELQDAAQGAPIPLPHFPQDLSEFGALVAQALSNLDARTAQLRADANAVAESSFIMARDAELGDVSLATALGGQ
ncbi:hypothetical protein [Corynebacterium sp.]|uniref:hypothetical protein n=1 Tax=Corynebacterium sp. TaxID=1720 RepID=UPI0026DC789F|nr:hypothetical protein [Corynebacterium sp.]MDO5031172.1 hypothetical protein [Corynebacterium sp.]